MNASVTPLQAGRIRDAMRVVRASGPIAVLSLFVSIAWQPAELGFALWPVAVGYLTVALLPLIRPVGVVPVALVSAIGMGGAVLEFVGVVAPQASGQFRISPLFGAGTIAIGAWFVGTAAIMGQLQLFSATIVRKAVLGGLGLVLVGSSWYLDATPSLVALLIGALLSGRIGPLFKELRTFGLPPAPAQPTAPMDDQ